MTFFYDFFTFVWIRSDDVIFVTLPVVLLAKPVVPCCVRNANIPFRLFHSIFCGRQCKNLKQIRYEVTGSCDAGSKEGRVKTSLQTKTNSYRAMKRENQKPWQLRSPRFSEMRIWIFTNQPKSSVWFSSFRSHSRLLDAVISVSIDKCQEFIV